MLLFVIIGAVIGVALGVPGGLFIGAAMGYGVGLLFTRVVLPRGLHAVQAQFFDSTFAVMGALCKADGQVSRDEIRVVEQFFDKLGLSSEQRQAAQVSFNRGKAPGFDLAAEVGRLRGAVGSRPALLQLFLQAQLSAVAADGVLHAAEREMLLRVGRLLGLSQLDLRRLEAALGVDAQRGQGGGTRGSAGSPGASLHDAYAALGVESTASDAEVKKAYRRLMSRYHPDKLAGQGLPENMRAVAKERVREVRQAYDRIRDSRDRGRAA